MTMQTFEDEIKSYLDEFAEEDELFAEAYYESDHTINECCDYLQQYMDNPAYPDLDCHALAIAYFEQGEDEIDPLDYCTAAPTPSHPFQTESEVEHRLHYAFNHGDAETLAYFAKFGVDLRKQILNARNYEQYRFCGYEGEFSKDEFGFSVCNKEVRQRTHEDIIFSEGYQWYLKLYTAQHPNGKWVAGTNYSYGTAGGLRAPSIWSEWHDTYEEAAREALEGVLFALVSDTTAKAKKYLPIVKRYLWNLKQSSLFNDEPMTPAALPTPDTAAPAPVQLTFDF